MASTRSIPAITRPVAVVVEQTDPDEWYVYITDPGGVEVCGFGDASERNTAQAHEVADAINAGHAPAPLLISTLKLARSALDATIHAGPGYDPEMLVLMQGEAFRAIDAALALRGGGREE